MIRKYVKTAHCNANFILFHALLNNLTVPYMMATICFILEFSICEPRPHNINFTLARPSADKCDTYRCVLKSAYHRVKSLFSGMSGTKYNTFNLKLNFFLMKSWWKAKP